MPSRPAGWSTFTVAEQTFPYDLTPVVAQDRVIDLQTEGHESEAATLVFGYRTRERNEVTQVVDGPIPLPVPEAYPRRHAARVSFGVGQASHAVELDVAEGTAVTVPTQVVEVTMLSYSAVFPVIDERPPALRSQASAAYGSSGVGVKTMPCLVPLGLYVLPGVGLPGQALPRLVDASDGADVDAAFGASMSRDSGASNPVEAYRAAVARVMALVPPVEPIGGGQ